MSGGLDIENAIKGCEKLLRILERLRAPDGCPWDRKQTHETMAPLVLEEAYEMADAVNAGASDKVAEELGDLCMNVFLIGLIAEEAGRFRLAEVFEKISAKLIYRHPHVFGTEGRKSVDAVLKRWEDLKRREREAGNEDASAVAGVPQAMPGLLRAYRTAEKMRRTGADLPPFREPLEQAAVLLNELRRGGGESGAPQREERLGRFLLAVCNAAAAFGVNPEMALRRQVDREIETFRRVEAELGEGLSSAPASRLDAAWQDSGNKNTGSHEKR